MSLELLKDSEYKDYILDIHRCNDIHKLKECLKLQEQSIEDMKEINKILKEKIISLSE